MDSSCPTTIHDSIGPVESEPRRHNPNNKKALKIKFKALEAENEMLKRLAWAHPNISGAWESFDERIEEGHFPISSDEPETKAMINVWAMNTINALVSQFGHSLSGPDLEEFLVGNRDNCLLLLKFFLRQSFPPSHFKDLALRTLPKILDIALNPAYRPQLSGSAQLAQEMEKSFAVEHECSKESCRQIEAELQRCKAELREKDELLDELITAFQEAPIKHEFYTE